MKGTFSRSVSLPMDIWGRVEAYAQRHGLSLSYAIHRCLTLGLEYMEGIDYGAPRTMEEILNAKKETETS
jgi:hypothetical protein